MGKIDITRIVFSLMFVFVVVNMIFSILLFVNRPLITEVVQPPVVVEKEVIVESTESAEVEEVEPTATPKPKKVEIEQEAE